MKLKSTLIFSLLITIIIGCDALSAEEIARLPINKVSVNDSNLFLKEASLNLKKGEQLYFWSFMDMEYDGDIEFLFKIEVFKDNQHYGYFEIDPTKKDITVGETILEFGGHTDWHFTGKNTQIEIIEDGNYTFKAILVATENPTLELTNAEIIIKK